MMAGGQVFGSWLADIEKFAVGNKSDAKFGASSPCLKRP
jgi:hypothetical protein